MQHQSRSFIIALIVIFLLIVVLIGAAILIFNPGAFRLLTNPASAASGGTPTTLTGSPISTMTVQAASPTAVLSLTPPTLAAAITEDPTAAPVNTLILSNTDTAPASLTAAVTLPSSPTLTNTATFTRSPTAARTFTATATLTATRISTATSSPTPTSTPTPSATATIVLNTDRAEFVTDVTIPDGTQFVAGTPFTKTWRIKNVGSTTWTTGYILEYTVGAPMTVQNQAPFPKVVLPGDTLDISMDLIAPPELGQHVSLFQFRNAAGDPFGVGPQFNEMIYVDITVIAGSTP